MMPAIFYVAAAFAAIYFRAAIVALLVSPAFRCHAYCRAMMLMPFCCLFAAIVLPLDAAF